MKLGAVLYNRPSLNKLMPDKMYLQQFFASCMGYYMDFNHPKTFNEKLHWLKLHDHNPLYTTLVDKHAVKSWAAEVIGEEYIIPTLYVYDSVDDICINSLPDSFVLKCTHDSGSVVICHNKKEFSDSSLDLLRKGLQQDYYLLGREWPYKNVPHRIIAEPFLSNDLKDYKFFCFNNIVRLYKIDFDRGTSHRANYYDRDSKLLPFGEVVCPPDFKRDIEIPSNITKMIELAERLSFRINARFVRIDFYNVYGMIKLGEITFYPAGGHGKFTEDGWDEKLGALISL